MSYCIPRRNWTTGTTYDHYEHNISAANTANSGATNLFDSTFVVMNSAYAVYKCIENDSNTASTVEPTSTSNSIVTTGDGYKWKYMYSLTSAETLNFMSTDFIHVSTDSTVTAAAVDGALDTIEVVAGGSSYSLSSGSTITAIPIRGDGSSGICSVTISSGAIASAAVTTAGTGYTYAYIRNADIITGTSAGGAGSGANLNVFIPPKGGHGKNAITELGGFYVMTNTTIAGTEGGGDFVVDQDFRRVGILLNPYNYGSATVATASTLNALKSMTFSGSPGTFLIDEVITGGTSGAKGLVVAWDSTTKILKYIQTQWTGVTTAGDETAFAALEVVTAASAATGTIASLTNPEIDYYSGKGIYVEDRAPISRATDQTENIKLIVEF